jgi:tight adherence protein C
MSGESRNERIMKAEEKAARLPAMLTVPMIIFTMPPLFVVLIGRAVLNTIDAFTTRF